MNTVEYIGAEYDLSAACRLSDLAGERALSEGEIGALIRALATLLVGRHRRGVAHGALNAHWVLLADDGEPTLVAASDARSTTVCDLQADVEMLACLGLELAPPGPLRAILDRDYATAGDLRDALASYSHSPLPAPGQSARRAELRGITHGWARAPAPARPAASRRCGVIARRAAVAAAALLLALCLLPRRSAPEAPCEPAQMCAPAK